MSSVHSQKISEHGLEAVHKEAFSKPFVKKKVNGGVMSWILKERKIVRVIQKV